MVGPISPELSELLVCRLFLRNRRGRPLVSVAAMLLSRGLFAFAAGYDQFYLGVAIALRTFRTETAEAWRNAEEVR